jgi:SAM-dependent methyltransferase
MGGQGRRTLGFTGRAMTVATPRQERAAAVFDSEVWPLLPEPSARLILDGLAEAFDRGLAEARTGTGPGTKPETLALELGCATGTLTLEVARRLGPGARVIALDESPALIALALGRHAREGRGPGAEIARVGFQAVALGAPWPVEPASCDLVFSNLGLAGSARPAADLAELAACLRPGGTLVATLPVQGCWKEFLDLYGDVLAEQGRREALAALRGHRDHFPRPAELATWVERAGLEAVAVRTARWELLFKSAREFFFAPVVELGPLPAWKHIAGGRGDDMQDVFFFVKEAIDTYFGPRPFVVTMEVACVKGRKP